MAADLNKLIPTLQSLVGKVIAECAKKDVEMRPFSTLRSPFEQAIAWRQSRALEEINHQINYLKNNGANFLADCLNSVGPQHGDHVTNALPGLSWHQWGEALDCFWIVDKKAEWSTRKEINGLNGYQVYADIAESMGLFPGGHWRNFKDWPHIQYRKDASPLGSMNLKEIDDQMKKKFGK